MARSRLSTSVTASCSAHSAVPGSRGSSGGEPSRLGPASARAVICMLTRAAQLMQGPPFAPAPSFSRNTFWLVQIQAWVCPHLDNMRLCRAQD